MREKLLKAIMKEVYHCDENGCGERQLGQASCGASDPAVQEGHRRGL
jgi:hypothetical protein